MKQKYVPLEKRSKKQQRKFHSQQRKNWGDISPVTKKIQNAKAYNRKKARQRDYSYDPMSGFFMCQEIARCASHFPVHCRSAMVLHNWRKERRQSRFLVCFTNL